MKILIIAGLLAVPLWAQQSSKDLNANIVAARAANKEMRYTDAEASMLTDATANPQSSLVWVELGTAEIGLKKYTEAETAFKKALGIDPETQKQMHQDDFYSVSDTATRASRNTADHAVMREVNPEIVGGRTTTWARLLRTATKRSDEQSAGGLGFRSQGEPGRRRRSILGTRQSSSTKRETPRRRWRGGEGNSRSDPNRAILYYFKGQGLVAKSTVDPQTQKMHCSAGVPGGVQKYLQLSRSG